MIINEIKESLPDNWEERFIHREGIDPLNYEVGIFPSENETDLPLTLVRNPVSGDIMEYFYDDVPEDYLIDLFPIFKSRLNVLKEYGISPQGKYFTNKKYDIITSIEENKNYKQRNFLKIKREKRGNYPRVGYFSKTTNNGHKTNIVKIPCHVAIGIIFVPNPYPEKFDRINHKDNNYDNCKIENLEWCDAKYNSRADKRKKPKNKFGYAKLDDNGNILETWTSWEDANLQIKYAGKQSSFNSLYIYKSIPRKYNGFFWKRIDLTLLEYISKHPFKDDIWYENKFIKDKKVEANLNGVLRIDGVMTVGSYVDNLICYDIVIGGARTKTHRIIYETISGKKLDKNDVIDHIIPVTRNDINNEFSNLKKCSQEENMNNPETLKEIRIIVKQFDLSGKFIKEYESIDSARKEYPSICSVIAGKSLSSSKYLWCKAGEEEKILKDTNYIFYRFNKNGILEESGLHLIDVIINREDKGYHWHYNPYINTGMPAEDGFFYQQGFPNEFLYDPENINLIPKRERLVYHCPK